MKKTWKKNRIFLFIIGFTIIIFSTEAQTPAFPGAEGFGMYSTGGRGGDVYHVSNLNDHGIGSLRYGIKTANKPRTIVFDISGNIMLHSGLEINKSNITIAGQTAPGDGITLGNGCLVVNGDNIIVRYIRCRLGDQTGGDSDAISIWSGTNIIFDHVTASWSVDETFSCQSKEIDSLTVQWCLVSESLAKSHHKKGSHGYGSIIGGIQQTFHHNLYAHHSSRSPKVTSRRHCEVDFRNNVIYNWGHNNCYGGTSSYINWVNNYYKAGPGTKKKVRNRIFELSDKSIAPDRINSPEDSEKYETSLYAVGNYVSGFPAVTEDNWAGGVDYMDDASESKNRVYKPFNYPAIQEQTPEEAYLLVLESAGASIKRDTLDKRIVFEVRSGTVKYGNSGLIDSQTDVGGYPKLNSLPAPVDRDQDGMPDDWEKQNGLNPEDSEDRNGDLNKDGYTNLEHYINSLAN